MKNNELLGYTKNGFPVYINKKSSHALTHFAKHPNLKNFVCMYLPKVDTAAGETRFEIDTGLVVGDCDLVETTENDQIIYAKRPHRETYSRFVKNKKPQPSNWIVVAINKEADKSYYLYTAFIGRLTPSFPGGNFRPEESISFWSNHALVYGNQDIIRDTETTTCPW